MMLVFIVAVSEVTAIFFVVITIPYIRVSHLGHYLPFEQDHSFLLDVEGKHMPLDTMVSSTRS